MKLFRKALIVIKSVLLTLAWLEDVKFDESIKEWNRKNRQS
jgi:hypothetical protein